MNKQSIFIFWQNYSPAVQHALQCKGAVDQGDPNALCEIFFAVRRSGLFSKLLLFKKMQMKHDLT